MTNINRMKESAGGVQVKIQSEDSEKAVKIFEDFRASYGVNKEEAVAYMKSIRRILVPVDFSVHAENAAFYALKIAEVIKADIKHKCLSGSNGYTSNLFRILFIPVKS